MKIIKSLLPVAICICSGFTLQAQQQKSGDTQNKNNEIAKPLEVKPAVAANDNPSAQSTFTPQPEAAAANAPATAKTVSPLTGKEEAKAEGRDKLEAKTFNKNDIAIPGGEEGRKIMTGNATGPKDPIYSPSTADAKPAPQVARPAGNKQ